MVMVINHNQKQLYYNIVCSQLSVCCNHVSVTCLVAVSMFECTVHDSTIIDHIV